MKAIIVMVLLLLLGTQSCSENQSQNSSNTDTVLKVEVDPGLKRKIDTSLVERWLKDIPPPIPIPDHIALTDSTMDTIMNAEIVITRIMDGPVVEGYTGPPRIVILSPVAGESVTMPMTLKFAVLGAPYRSGTDKFKFLLDEEWRLITDDPGTYEMSGLPDGPHELFIRLIPGPGYPPPVPAAEYVTFTSD